MTYFPPRNLEANILKKREDKTLAMTDDKNEENPKVGYRKTLTNVKAIAHAQKASRVLFTVTSFRAAAGFWAACPCKGREECCSSERHMQNTSFAM